jgi:phosphoketolase
MTLQRVQMLLEPRQRKQLAELAKAQGKSVAEITRLAIDAGLEQISAMEGNQRLLAVLEAAQRLRASMPAFERDIVSDLRLLQQERDHELLRGD